MKPSKQPAAYFRFYKSFRNSNLRLLSHHVTHCPVPGDLPVVRGVEVPMARNVSIPSRFQKQKYQPDPVPRPFKNERCQGSSGLKNKLKRRTVAKKRSGTGKKSDNHLPKRISLAELIPTHARRTERPKTAVPSSYVVPQQEHIISIPQSQSLSNTNPGSTITSRPVSRQNSVNECPASRPVTEVRMVQKPVEAYKSEYWNPEQSVCDNSNESVNSLPDESADKRPIGQKLLEQIKPELFNIRRSLDSTKDRIAKRVKDAEPNARAVSSMGEVPPHQWLTQPKRPVTHCGERHLQSDDDYDEDMKMPTLVDYHQFQPIYKNDGLQFDESWQDRMLDRYLMLKKQREERHASCSQRRAELEQDRKFKILSNKPELTYGDMYAWYQDHARLADYILSSPLLSGNRGRSDYEFSPRRPLATPLVPFPRKDSHPPAGRPPSAADQSLDSRDRHHSIADNDSSEMGQTRPYRFSLRHNEQGDGRTVRHSSATSASTKSPRSSRTRLHHDTPRAIHTPFSSTKSHQLLLVQRPRSSASIPAKTRYILVKDEDSFAHRLHPPTPSRMEEDLLRKRFPVQHQSVLKAMKKLRMDDSEADVTEFDDWDLEDFNYTSDGDDLPEEGQKSLQPQKSSAELSPRSSTTLQQQQTFSNGNRIKISKDKPLQPRETSSPIAKKTPYGYSPISVMHRRTSGYIPISKTFKV